mmetsp:Transcript_23932/g.51613  ORF Transcript_23932/g.51613 Transcript_23932/m.51613 type:complete len:93 (+) Transcript_23932:104-382(+)
MKYDARARVCVCMSTFALSGSRASSAMHHAPHARLSSDLVAIKMQEKALALKLTIHPQDAVPDAIPNQSPRVIPPRRESRHECSKRLGKYTT